jgi:hypothetical protein
MNFIEHHNRPHARTKKHLWVADHILDRGQIAIDVMNAMGSEAFRQCRLAHPPDTRQPGNGRLPPRVFNSFPPEWSFNHACKLHFQSYQM